MSRKVDLDYSKFETLGEIKNKYPDSTIVMRKHFIDMAIEHEWNHGRPVGNQLGISTELDPRCNAGVISRVLTDRIAGFLTPELEHLLSTLADEFGRLYVRVTFYKEPR